MRLSRFTTVALEMHKIGIYVFIRDFDADVNKDGVYIVVSAIGLEIRTARRTIRDALEIEKKNTFFKHHGILL